MGWGVYLWSIVVHRGPSWSIVVDCGRLWSIVVDRVSVEKSILRGDGVGAGGRGFGGGSRRRLSSTNVQLKQLHLNNTKRRKEAQLEKLHQNHARPRREREEGE